MRIGRIIRVATINIGDGSDHLKLLDMEDLYIEGVEIFLLEEHADRDDVTDEFCRRHPEFGKWAGDGRPGALKQAIVYKKGLGPVTAEESVTLVGARHLPQGAGPENASPKVSNRIRIRIDGVRVNIYVEHQYATVNNRKSAARAFLRALTRSLTPRLRSVLIVGGDWNQSPNAVMMHALRVLLPGVTKTGPTLGNRVIDAILVRGAKILKAWTFKTTSDHKTVIADIQL